MKTPYDRSTADGQTRLFYEVASDIGWKDGNEGKPQNSPNRQYVRGWNDGNESRNA